MCVIIYQPSGKTLTKQAVQNCWNANRDGGGYMFSVGGKVVIRKGFFGFAKFWRSYRSDYLGMGKGQDFVLHMRIATHGKIDAENCHPFRIDANTAFCHNGIIRNIFVPANSPLSDTALFGQQILQELPKTWLHNDAIVELVEKYLGGNKIAVLDKKGDVWLFNENLGLWDGGIWYSNNSYKAYKPFGLAMLRGKVGSRGGQIAKKGSRLYSASDYNAQVEKLWDEETVDAY